MSDRISRRPSKFGRRAVRVGIETLERRDLPAISLIPSTSSLGGSEGTSVTFDLGRFTDTSTANQTWTVTVDWGDGTSMTPIKFSKAGTIGSTSHVYSDNGTYKITEKVVSSRGQSDTKTITASISNVAPILTPAATTYTATVSDFVTAKVSATDASTKDTTAGFIYTWDFGDGTAKVSGPGYTSVSHAYGAAGNYTITVTAADKDGGVSTAALMKVSATMAPIPDRAKWESQMTTYGAKVAASLADPYAGTTVDTLLGQTYYDGERVFQQIADYTKDPSWNTAARNAEVVYRDRYVLPNNAAIPGYWDFAEGLAKDYLRTGDAQSKNTVLLLSQNAAYCGDSGPLEWTADAGKSREVAYAIETLIWAEALGGPVRTRLSSLVDQALGHIDQWFVSKTAAYFQPFMVGLTCEALIDWYAKTGDSRVLPAVKTALDAIWTQTWDATSKSFLYVNVPCSEGNPTPAPDLNLLIAPAYAWVYHVTGDSLYRNRGDQVFQGGVDGAWLDGAKQFNQSYRWSFDFVNWRSQSPLTAPVISSTLSVNAVTGQSAVEAKTMTLDLGSIVDVIATDAPWTVSVDWGDKSTPTSLTVYQTGPIPSATHIYNDSGAYTVTEKITSSNGIVVTKSIGVTVSNLPPTASFGQGPFSATVSDAATLTASATDPSSVDTAAGFVYNWNFGDGTTLSGLGLSSVTHIYRATGTYSVQVTATDKDGATSPVATTTVNAVMATIAGLSSWQSRMTTYGQQFATSIAANPSASLGAFDVGQVYQQIADYTASTTWATTAQIAENYYRDSYVIPNSGGVSATYNYGRGLATDYQRYGNAADKTALSYLVQNAAYAGVNSPTTATQDASRSVPVAQGILTLLAAADLGIGNSTRLGVLASQALDHVSQWFVTKTALTFTPAQVGMTLMALIRWGDATGDTRAQNAVKTALDWMWSNCWSTSDQGFRSVNRSTTTIQPADPNPNLLIAPAFAWYYRQTGDVTYRNNGDTVFSAGVAKAAVANSLSLFADNYIWSFDFVKWRQQSPKV